MASAVSQLMSDLGAGGVTLEQAVEQLRDLLVPMVAHEPATTVDELYRREQSDELPPDQPDNSWQDVLDAYQVRQVITSGQFYELLARVPRPAAVSG